MPVFHTYIITAPGQDPVYHDYKGLLQLTKRAVNSPKYQQWLKISHLLPVWTEDVEDKKLLATKFEYIKLYLEGQGYTFEEI